MTRDRTLTVLQKEYQALEAALQEPLAPTRRAEIKDRLVELLRRTDAAISELGTFRESLRTLGQRYKEAVSAQGPLAPDPPITRPITRHDRLGASTFVEKGWHLISVGEPAEAARSLMRALELAPDDVQARALLGWAEMLQEDHDRAMVTFARVLEADPENTLARVNVGYVCLRKGIFGEAIEHLSRVIRQDRDRKATLYAHYYLGLVYLERGMYADAVSFLGRAVDLGPNLIEARAELGRALWHGGQRAEALGTWRAGAEHPTPSVWSTRCAELLRAAEAGEEVPRSPR